MRLDLDNLTSSTCITPLAHFLKETVLTVFITRTSTTYSLIPTLVIFQSWHGNRGVLFLQFLVPKWEDMLILNNTQNVR